MSGRRLSKLQKAYRSFFLSMLSEYEVDSPAKLSYEEKIEFFTRIRIEWAITKRKLLEIKIEKKVVATKKSQYSKIQVPRTAIALEPKESTKFNNPDRIDTDVSTIFSQQNPDQTEDLRIKFHPNQLFEQNINYVYPVTKMPNEGSHLKLPREGRGNSKGYKEQDFYNALESFESRVEVRNDMHLAVPNYNRPYEPDIVLIDKSLGLYVDIEIDEPYEGYYRFPTHEIGKDDTRDLFFTESGWVVIRFTERQVHEQEKQCLAYIKDVLNSIYDYNFNITAQCKSENQWDYQQGVRWEQNLYREKYLGIERFHKQPTRSQVLVDPREQENIELELNRTKLYESDSEAVLENVAFEDELHRYHHPKDETGNAEYISVTTLIDRFFPFDLDRFVQRKSEKEGKSEDEVLEEFERSRDEAAKKGTILHEQIERFLKDDDYDDSSKEFLLFQKFYNEVIMTKGFEYYDAEKRILLKDYNIAGTVDALFKKPRSDEFLIVDWKRSKKLLIDGRPKKYGYGYALSDLGHLDNSSYYKYALQQNIYKYILENQYGLKVSSMNLIVLHDLFDNYYRISLENMHEEVKVILNSINHKI